jgi:predicted nucleic acid-binding protein
VADVTLDTGALIAIERGDPRMQALLDEAAAVGADLAVPPGVLAQAWRGSPRRARLARFLALGVVEVVALEEPEARAAGTLCGRAGTEDVIDASLVVCARMGGHSVITGDPDDVAALDLSLRIVAL